MRTWEPKLGRLLAAIGFMIFFMHYLGDPFPFDVVTAGWLIGAGVTLNWGEEK